MFASPSWRPLGTLVLAGVLWANLGRAQPGGSPRAGLGPDREPRGLSGTHPGRAGLLTPDRLAARAVKGEPGALARSPLAVRVDDTASIRWPAGAGPLAERGQGDLADTRQPATAR
jgi:hypothetical protein